MSVLSGILGQNQFTVEELPAFEEKLYFEGARRQPYLVRFTVLLFLATVIAGGGIIADSTATVIGAMIIAPLMTPIMATAAALVVGRMDRAVRSLMLVGAGVALVILISWLLGTVISGVVSYTSDTQVTSRTAPRLIDLIVALASGAAGAFAMSREDVADSLPGVAISISLVPPLAVVGIALSDREWGAASGALLLFLTNFLSILFAGGGVLALLGLGRVSMVRVAGRARRNAFLAVGAGILLISLPLSATSFRVTQEALTELQMGRIAQEWVAGSEYEVRSVQVLGDEVQLLVAGPGEPPPSEALAAALEEGVSRPLRVDLQIVRIELDRLDVLPATSR